MNLQVLEPFKREAYFQHATSGTITGTIKLEMLDTVHIRLDQGKTNPSSNYNGFELRKIYL